MNANKIKALFETNQRETALRKALLREQEAVRQLKAQFILFRAAHAVACANQTVANILAAQKAEQDTAAATKAAIDTGNIGIDEVLRIAREAY